MACTGTVELSLHRHWCYLSCSSKHTQNGINSLDQPEEEEQEQERGGRRGRIERRRGRRER